MQNPLVSIIIPNFNKAPFIAEMVASLKAQTYADFEAIFVDDGSTDTSVEKFKQCVGEDMRFMVIQHESSKGGSAARNTGFANSSGEFVMFFDSDDLLASTCLEKRIEKFKDKQYDECDFLVFSMGCFKEKIGDCESMWCPKMEQDHLFNFLSHRMPWSVMQPLWRRSFLEKLKINGFVGPFDEEFPRLQDVEMHTHALLLNPKYHCFERSAPDCCYRIDLSRTSASREGQLTRQIKGFCRYIQVFGTMVQNSPKLQKSLRLTFFEALVTLCYWNNQTAISKEFEKAQRDALLAVAYSTSLLNQFHKIIVAVYCTMLRGRIKGVNWLTRKFLSM